MVCNGEAKESGRLLAGISEGMDMIDMAFAYISLNHEFEVVHSNSHFGHMADQYHLSNRTLISWFKGSPYQKYEELKALLQKKGALSGESRGHADNGSSYHFQWSLKLSGDTEALCLIRDVRWRQRYHNQWTLFERIFNSGRASIVVTDASNRIVLANKRFEEVSGYSAAEVMGLDPGCFGSGRQDKAFYRELWRGLMLDGYWCGLIWNRRKDGREYPEQKTIYTVQNEEGQITHYFSSGELVLHNDAPTLLSSLSPGQSNSIMSQQGLIEQLSKLQSADHQPTSIFYIGIDNMGRLNRHGGMALGDHFVRTTLKRLTETFLPEGLVARSVGDEFIVAAPHVISPVQAEKIAQHLLAVLQSSVEYQSIEWRATVSIGVSLLKPGDRPRLIIEQAHIAMHHAKEQGGNSSHFFSCELQDAAKEGVLLEQALYQAMDRGEFSLNYQPIVDTRSGALVGAEALLRWHSEEFGFVSPDRFIPIAEHSGLIHELGRWVFAEACQQVNRLGASFTGSIAVNLSAHQLQYAGLAEQLVSLLNTYAVPVERIALEITETAMIQDANSAVSVVADLKDAGFMLSIDDFGTGYSSLSYLTRFQLDKLKVDRCFVQKMTEQPQERQVTKAIIQLAKSLGMTIVAEGVETEEQRSELSLLNCDYLQGYLISKPLTEDAFVEYLQHQRFSEEPCIAL